MTVLYIVIMVAFLGTLLAISIVDLRTMEIPDFFHVIILALAVLDMALRFFAEGNSVQLLSRIIGVFCVSLPMFLICLAIDGAFGGGDIKMMAACGLYLGWKLTLIATFFGILFGGIWGIILLATKNAARKDHFAFGPFLCAGMAISLFWGERLLSLYLEYAFG